MTESPNDRLKRARELAGYKSAAAFAAAFDFPESTYRSIENGTRSLTMSAAKQYASKLGCTWAWLMEGGPAGAPTGEKINPDTNVTLKGSASSQTMPQSGNTNKIKVLGMAECGPDGWALWNGEVVDMIDRPPCLSGATQGFAVYVVGTSMENRYHPGEVVYVHPGRPVTIGSYVLVQIHPPEGDTTPRAVIKRLAKRSGDKVILEQYSPAKTFTLKVAEILSIHKIVGSGDA